MRLQSILVLTSQHRTSHSGRACGCSPGAERGPSCSNLMEPGMIFRWPRWVPILVVLALAAFSIVSIRSLREPVLRAAGWALVVNEPLASADIIVVSFESGGAGALEAADLV